MNYLTTYRRLSWVGLLAIALLVVGCVKPVPTDELPATVAPAPTLENPVVLPTAPPPTVDPLQPTPEPETQPGTEATAEPQSPPTSDGQTVHVVAPGDTLFSISQQYGVPIDQIMAANGITDPNNLVVGTQLVIPAPGSVTVPPTPAPGTEQVYTVKAGDNLFRIGLSYGCTVDQLAAYNGIVYPYTIFVGQQIRIPPDC
ncbi:MAG TPA: LysM peptidoglycan-binding domain-containing protein [Chloroflexota bacterium]|nr:LysM peptidoglycan-binding domain-containing protein [Chloroflexota bacterium]